MLEKKLKKYRMGSLLKIFIVYIINIGHYNYFYKNILNIIFF